MMQLAIDTALKGVSAGAGGPFGAVIVKNNQVLAACHNTVLRDKDPTAHAEVNAIRLAAKSINDFNLTGCELYTTAEPCPMCLAAIYWARIDKIYVGVSRGVAASYGFIDQSLYDELRTDNISERQIPMVLGIEAKQCQALFTTWQQLNPIVY